MLQMIGGADGEGSVGEGMYSTVQNVKDNTYSMYGTCHRVLLLSTEHQRQKYSLQNFTHKSEHLRQHTARTVLTTEFYLYIQNIYDNLCSMYCTHHKSLFMSLEHLRRNVLHIPCSLQNYSCVQNVYDDMDNTYCTHYKITHASTTSMTTCTAHTVIATIFYS